MFNNDYLVAKAYQERLIGQLDSPSSRPFQNAWNWVRNQWIARKHTPAFDSRQQEQCCGRGALPQQQTTQVSSQNLELVL